MAIEFDSDFNGYFDADFGHGSTVTYTPQGGNEVSIKIILEQQYFGIDVGTVDVEGFQPIAFCKTTDVPNIAHGDTIVAPAYKNLDGTTIKSGATYKVINVMPDNTGVTQVNLQEQ